MPAAVAIPIALAGASMIAQNVQNKAALKNNQTQQQGAVSNAQQAYQKAQDALNAFNTAHPAPFGAGGSMISRPTPYGSNGVPIAPPVAPSGAAAVPPSSGLANPGVRRPPGTAPMPNMPQMPNTQIPAALLQQILQRMGSGGFGIRPQPPMATTTAPGVF